MTAECVFCAIAAGDAPAEVVAEWGTAVGIVPLNPVTPGHVLVIPRAHVTDVADDPNVTAGTMRCAALWVREHCADANVITSRGPAATQTVFHLHVHVVPRTAEDGLHLPWTGQQPHSTPEGTFYHWAPRTARDSILTWGLEPGYPSTHPMHNLDGTEWRAPYVCLGLTPSSAWGYSVALRPDVPGGWDCWQVLLTPDDQAWWREDGDPEVRVTRVRKTRVWLVGFR